MLLRLVGQFTYAAVFGLLLAGGVGLPVPEELVQLTAGYLARRGVLSLVPAVAVAWVGLVGGDYLLFRLGRRLGPAVLDSPHVRRVLTPARRAFVERHFARHAVLTIMAARHASGLRLPVFALAGASGVRSATFLIADGASALVSVPLVVSLGWYFAGHIEQLKKDVHAAEFVVAALAAAFFAIWVAVVRRKERRAVRPPS
ncbi:MAG TPA: DedA family protein [Anaeromyxobacteraceae bacterium]|nr:DedA family protein [Anaeromyxobacteraceae bacterium]